MIGDRTFREAVRTVTVSYPIPFLVVAMMAGGIVMLGLYAATKAWPLAFAGVISVVSPIALAAYAVVRRPDLLRSEKSVFQSRLIEIIEDGDLNPDAQIIIGEALASTLDPIVAKQPAHLLAKVVRSEEDTDNE